MNNFQGEIVNESINKDLQMEKIINNAIKFVKDFFDGESSGHDYFHTMRVFQNAKHLYEIESKNQYIDKLCVYLAALLHDVDDFKLSPETSINKDNADRFLKENKISDNKISFIKTIIGEVSYLGKDSITPKTIESKIVQDADRLDAIGAIGIARTFAFGGKHGRPIYDPEISPKLNMGANDYKNHKAPTINHFYEKLLLLKDLMNTDGAKIIAENRTTYMQNFLDEFYDEWNGKK